MARKERFTTAQVIGALEQTKGMKAQAARRLGCHVDTVTNYEKRYPTVAAAIRQAREEMTDVAELALSSAILRGEGWAVCFYLKTQGKRRGYVEKIEVDVLLKQELESVVGILEDALEPDEFRKVAGVLARQLA